MSSPHDAIRDVDSEIGANGGRQPERGSLRARRTEAVEKEPRELQARKAWQAAALERLRRESERVTEQLIARDLDLERALTELLAVATDDESRERLGYRCMVQRFRRFVSQHVEAGTAVALARTYAGCSKSLDPFGGSPVRS